MTSLKMKLSAFGNIVCLTLALLTLLAGAAAAQDINKIWTAAASTGVPDETSQPFVVFTESIATVSPAAPLPTTLILRYNVTAVDGLFTGPLHETNWPTMIVRYRDADAATRVLVELKEHILAGPGAGQTNTLITFDSNEFPQLPGYQTQSIGNCGNFAGFQFTQGQSARVYFIEARLIRNGSAILGPGLAGLAITRYGVCQGFDLTQR